MKRNKKLGLERDDKKTFVLIAVLFFLSVLLGIVVAISIPKEQGEKEVIVKMTEDTIETEEIETK